MPLYEYQCDACDTVKPAMQSIAKRNQAPPCPTCDGPRKRIYLWEGRGPEIYMAPAFMKHGIKYEDGSGMATATKLSRRVLE